MAILRKVSRRSNPRKRSLFDKLEEEPQHDVAGYQSMFHCIGTKEVGYISMISHVFDEIMDRANGAASRAVGEAIQGDQSGAVAAAYYIDFVDAGDEALDLLTEGLSTISVEIRLLEKRGIDTDALLRKSKLNIGYNEPMIDGLAMIHGLLESYLQTGGENFVISVFGSQASPQLAKNTVYKLLEVDFKPTNKC